MTGRFTQRARFLTTLAAVSALALCALAPSAPGAPADPSPVVLYGELLLSIFPNQIVPRGYVVTNVEKYPLSLPSRGHHAVGAVVVNLNHSHAGIVYVVFPTKADLLARWRDGPGSRGRLVVVSRKVAGAREIDGWTRLDGRRVGATDVVFHDSVVLISVITTSATHRNRGDRLGALRLARAGLAQLRNLNR
jgi:hypothetical protein